VLVLVGQKGGSFVRETIVEQQNLCSSCHLGKKGFTSRNFLENGKAGTGGKICENLGPIGQEVVGIIEEDGFRVGDEIHLGLEAEDFSFFSDETSVGDCETVEEVHEDNHDEKNEGNEDDVAEGVFSEGDVTELKLSNKHGNCFDKTCSNTVKEDVSFRIRLSPLVVGVKHDVETQGKSHNKWDVPEQECDESGDDFVEHGDVDAEAGMLAELDDEFHPRDDDRESSHVSLGLKTHVLIQNEDSCHDEKQDFEKVFRRNKISFEGHSNLEKLHDGQVDDKNCQHNLQHQSVS